MSLVDFVEIFSSSDFSREVNFAFLTLSNSLSCFDFDFDLMIRVSTLSSSFVFLVFRLECDLDSTSPSLDREAVFAICPVSHRLFSGRMLVEQTAMSGG